jgi:hypothetical protein
VKKKYYIYLLILLLFTGNQSKSADYYPELGIDPFYSSLNPAYTNNEEFENSQEYTFANFIKKQKQKIADKKQNKEEQKTLPKAEKVKKEKAKPQKEEKNEKEKKPLTRKQLEKELMQEEREKEKEAQKVEKATSENTNIFQTFTSAFKTKKNVKEENSIPKDTNIEITADFMDYYPESFEVEAIGNAKVVFKAQNITLNANKIKFNYDKNILTANENVILISGDSVTEGDFVRIELNKPNGWIENPETVTDDVKLTAKEAYLYSDRIEEYDGVAKILKNDVLTFGARSFASYVDQSRIFVPRKNQLTPNSTGVYKLKADTIVIDSKDDHEVITIKNADLYLKKHKLATIPSVKIVTNKQHASVETNIPEFGSQSMLGMHIGPAIVLNVPGGSTLKLAPILTYKDDKIGVGGIARFRNQYNMTEVAYGTSKDELLIRGRQRLAPGLLLNYSRYTNQNEWFFGYRMPKYSAQLTYSRSDYVKDLKLNFSQMYSAGVFVDNRANQDFRDAEGRFRWMTQTFKPLYKYYNNEGNIMFTTGLVAQTSATAYTTGDTTGLVRIGPAIHSQVGPWQQGIMFYETGIAGKSPFDFDRYRYGRSNLVVIESLRICKYLTVGYLASIAMNREVQSDKSLQENRLLVSVGPDYAKLTLGYDSMRRTTSFALSMLVGTKDSDIKFKKSIMKNPNKFGKSKAKSNNNEKREKKRFYKKCLKEAEKTEL